MKKYWYIVSVIVIIALFASGFVIFCNEAKASSYQQTTAYADELRQQDQDLTRAINEQEKARVAEVNEQIKKQEEERKAAEEKAKREAEAKAAAQKATSSTSYSQPSGNGVLTKSNGSIHYNGHRETWYSTNEAGQNVTAYSIPGKHVGDDGIIRDKDGYICVASKNHGAGTVIETSRGTGKVYDKCGTDAIDIYTAW